MITVAVARHLDQLGLVTFDETGATGDAFHATMPASPNAAVAIMPGQPSPQLTKAPTDLPAVQILVRGDPHDSRTPFDKAAAIYSALNVLDHTTLDAGGTDEVYVIGCTAAQSGPVWLGQDANRRHEFALNFDMRTQAPTAHRPAVTAWTP